MFCLDIHSALTALFWSRRSLIFFRFVFLQDFKENLAIKQHILPKSCHHSWNIGCWIKSIWIIFSTWISLITHNKFWMWKQFASQAMFRERELHPNILCCLTCPQAWGTIRGNYGGLELHKSNRAPDHRGEKMNSIKPSEMEVAPP